MHKYTGSRCDDIRHTRVHPTRFSALLLQTPRLITPGVSTYSSILRKAHSHVHSIGTSDMSYIFAYLSNAPKQQEGRGVEVVQVQEEQEGEFSGGG